MYYTDLLEDRLPLLHLPQGLLEAALVDPLDLTLIEVAYLTEELCWYLEKGEREGERDEGREGGRKRRTATGREREENWVCMSSSQGF